LWNEKTSAVFLGLIIFGGILSLAYSVSTDFTTIRSTGSIATNEVVARSGSAQDIQSAVDAVSSLGGGTVHIPAGNFSFNLNPTRRSLYGGSYPASVLVPNGVSIIGAGINQTILYQTSADLAYNESYMFYVYNNVPHSQQKPMRISGMTLLGYVGTYENDHRGIQLDSVQDFRVDHIWFNNFPGWAIGTWNPHGRDSYNTDERGVIDHIKITNTYKLRFRALNPTGGGLYDVTWAYGINAGGDGGWEEDISNLLGHYDGIKNIIYIEDSVFAQCRHAITCNQNMFYVARHNIFYPNDPYMQVDVHGFNGGRGLEVYDNTLIGPNRAQQIAIGVRGGGGAVYNNVFVNEQVGVELLRDPGSYDSRWPVHNLWVWNNSGATTDFVDGDSYVQGVDYFLYAAPNYTPYPYPHPLALQP
jgi:hypothetical protein